MPPAGLLVKAVGTKLLMAKSEREHEASLQKIVLVAPASASFAM
jgi:hypothetical protein